MKLQILSLLALASLTLAWLPKDKNYFAAMPHLQTRSESISSSGHRTFKDRRYLPSSTIKGVNLGSQFIIEKWMASTEWSNMGCGSANSEFDCVSALGQEQANSVWATHWASWITSNDISTMVSYGLNTIRIPLGYWIIEGLVYEDSEHFPQGGLPYLLDLCQAATDAGMYIILDLHGAPGAQVAQQPFTGQYASTPGFYQDYQYQRAYWFLGNITEMVFNGQNPQLKGVGMIEILNEPVANEPTLVSEYYPNAVAAVRAVESSYGVAEADQLHIQMMDERWGSGIPEQDISNTDLLAYDDHSYLKYDTRIEPTQENYLSAACNLDLTSSPVDSPVIVGEWCISPNTTYQDDSDFATTSANAQFYTNWWSAQVQAYNKQDGWIFWSWKTNLGDYRWDYQLAVQSGIIPTDPDDASNFDCSVYT